jgi:LysM repeat protein
MSRPRGKSLNSRYYNTEPTEDFASIDLELKEHKYENDGTHTLSKDDTLISLALKYGITEEEIKRMNNFTDFDAYGKKTLIVPKSDDSYRISTSIPKRSPSIPTHLGSTKSPVTLRRVGHSYQNISQHLPKSPSMHKLLTIPKTSPPVSRESGIKQQIHEGKSYYIHYLSRSDSLSSLAVRYGVTQDVIVEYNDCDDLDTYAGDYIMIPKPEEQS